MSLAQPGEPGVGIEPALSGVHVCARRPDELRVVHAADRVLAADRRHPQAVVEGRVPRKKARRRAIGPFECVGRAERGIDDVAACERQPGVQRILVAEERMDVAYCRTLRPGFAQHVRVAGIQALDRGAFVAGSERADQVVAQLEHEDMPVERRPVLLADHEQAVGRRNGVRLAAGQEVLVIEDAVVLVRNLFVDHVLVFGRRHHHQVFRSVVQVAGVVHVDMGGPVVPATRGQVGDRPESKVGLHRFPRHDLQRRLGRGVLETLDGLDRDRPRRHLEVKRSRLVEHGIARVTDSGIRVRRCIGLAVGRAQVNAGRRRAARGRVQRAHGNHAHGSFPAPLGDRHLVQSAAVNFEQLQLRQAVLVGNEGEPFTIGRPARMKRVVAEERELVWLATTRRLQVEVAELVGGPASRRVDEALAVGRDVRPGPIERVFREHRRGRFDAVPPGG